MTYEDTYSKTEIYLAHNKVCNGSASPHLICGWLRHLIRKPDAASHNLNNGVTERVPMKSSGQLIPREITTIIASQVLSNATQRDISNDAIGAVSQVSQTARIKVIRDFDCDSIVGQSFLWQKG